MLWAKLRQQQLCVHSPWPGGTFALLRLASGLQFGALQLRLQRGNPRHQLLQLLAGLGPRANPLGVRHPAFVLLHTTGGW